MPTVIESPLASLSSSTIRPLRLASNPVMTRAYGVSHGRYPRSGLVARVSDYLRDNEHATRWTVPDADGPLTIADRGSGAGRDQVANGRRVPGGQIVNPLNGSNYVDAY